MEGRALVSHGSEQLQRECLLSHRGDYLSPRDDGCSTKDSYSSRDYIKEIIIDYVPPLKDYIYHEYSHSSSHDYPTKGFSGRDGHIRIMTIHIIQMEVPTEIRMSVMVIQWYPAYMRASAIFW